MVIPVENMMFEHIRKDIFRYHRKSKSMRLSDALRLLWHQPGLKALVVYRMGRWLLGNYRYPVFWLPILLLMPLYWLSQAYVRLAYDIYLYQSSYISPGLSIGHFGGIHLRNCRLGENCSVQQEVCLEPGRGSTSGPTIGSRVWIGSHSQIKGNVLVGDGATIGAGTVVENDVPEGCLLLGNPARVVYRNYDNSGFL